MKIRSVALLFVAINSNSSYAQSYSVPLRLQKPDTTIFPPSACAMLKSNFRIKPGTLPSNFKPVSLQEFQPQEFRVSADNYAKAYKLLKNINHHKVIFGFVNGNEYYIIDTNNDGNFLDEKMYRADANDQPIIQLQNVQLLINGQLMYSNLAVQYLKMSLRISVTAPKRIFFVVSPYAQGTFKINHKTIYAAVKKSDLLFEKPAYQVAISDTQLNATNSKNIKYSPGDTAVIDGIQIIIAKNATDKILPVQVNLQNKFAGYEIGANAIQVRGIDILSGKMIDTKLMNTKLILLDFWGTWCIPCRKINPRLEELNQMYSSKGLTIISIANDDRLSDVRKYLRDTKIHWFNIFEQKNNPADYSAKYKIQEYPTFILINSSGHIVLRLSGIQDFAQLENTISRALSSR